MPARPVWQGFLKLSLISVPLKAYRAAVSGDGKTGFNQIHAACNSRIRYKKVCPVHGEVSNDEIVPGYQYAKGQYVVISPEELDKLRTESDKAITIDLFVRPETLDPVYQTGNTYYLVPDGPVGQKPYAVIQKVMADQGRHAIARVVFRGKEETVLLRPLDGLLAMTTLRYENQIKKPSSFEEEVPRPKVGSEELEMARSLVAAGAAESFDFSAYRDRYRERLAQLVDIKVQGKEVVTPPAEEAPAVINLMDALRQSLNQVREASPSRAAPPRKKMARRKEHGKRKRRTG
jgi:DNA end-binding protein Ku